MLWPLMSGIYNIVKEFAKIVGLPQILKLPLFAGHPSMWQMFVYSIFSTKISCVMFAACQYISFIC